MKNYTFGQAKQLLASAPYLRAGRDIGGQINDAVSALAGLGAWECLRRLVRLFSATPVFSLPQGVAGLTRVCVNGTPASLHGLDYQFLHSGPGDLDNFLKRGFGLVPARDVADLGFSPTMYPVGEPSALVAVAAHVGTGRPQPPVTVTGYTPTGIRVTQAIEVIQGTRETAPDYSEFHRNSEVAFASIERVVLGEGTDDYVTLWGLGRSGRAAMLGHYHPQERVPALHQYRIKAPGRGPYDLLAEVRVDPLPLIDDSDVVPLPSLEPIRLMMLYAHQVGMNELASAQQYLQQATQWLQQMQVADHTVQTPVVQNVLFEGSGGDVEPSCNL